MCCGALLGTTVGDDALLSAAGRVDMLTETGVIVG